MGLSTLVQVFFLAELSTIVQTLPSARLQAVLPACLLALQLRCLPRSLKQCCPLQRGSRSGGATRTRLAVPPARVTLFPMQLWQCSLHVPGRCLACVQRCLVGKRFSRPWWWATLALLQSFSQAEFTSPSPSWRLMEDRSCSSRFLTQHRFIACRSQCHYGIPHTCYCGATRQHLWFEQMKGYP